MFGRFKGFLEDSVGKMKHGRMNKEIKILMFHNIGKTAEYGPQKYSVTEEDFQRVISDLSDTYEFVPLSDIVSWLNGAKKLPDKTMAVTFDDGYLSTKEKALPILKRHNIPFTVYMPSEFLDIPNPARFRLFQFIENNDEISFELEKEKYDYGLETPEEKKEAYNEIISVLDRLNVSDRHDFLNSAGISEVEEGLLMSEKDLKDLDSEELVSIGSHSTDHRNLTRIKLKDAKKSIKDSKKKLEDILGHKVSSFSYPFGSANEHVMKVVEESFDNAVITGNRTISERDWGNIYKVPRIDGKDL